MNSPTMNYRISTVADITGIPRNTLIAWERRYGLVAPERHANGYRSYSEANVAQLLRIKNALNAGLKISEAISLVNSQEPETRPEESKNAVDGISPFQSFREDLLNALGEYRGADAQKVLARSLTIPFRTRLHELYFPVLREAGNRWAAGTWSIAQEHYASGIIKAHMATLFINTTQPSLTAPHAVCTTLPHEEHEIGALALAIQLSMDGYRVSYLGGKLPAADLIGFCEKQKPVLVCLSCITLPSEEDFSEYLDKIAQVPAAGCRTVIGGECLRGQAPRHGIELIPNWGDFLA
jgi:DNA-binding transcriptional MerR regulator